MTLRNYLTIFVTAAVATAPYWIPAMGIYAPAATALVAAIGAAYHLNQPKP